MNAYKKLPTTTVSQSRLQVYEPTRRPKESTRQIETPWGHALIIGKLGQGHADVVESIFRNAIDWRVLEDPKTNLARILILVDPYHVRKTAYGGGSGTGAGVENMLRDVMRSLIELRLKNGDTLIGHIIDQVEMTEIEVNNPLGGKRHLWRVTVGAAYVELMGRDLHLHYDPLPIAALSSGVAQAIARHVATHSSEPSGGWFLDGLISSVGAGGDYKIMKKRRQAIRSDASGLAACGITVDVDGRVHKTA